MDQTLVELIKALGYPLGSALTIGVIFFIWRQFFEKTLESIVSRDLEMLRHQNSVALEKIVAEKKHELDLALENRKDELSKEAEKLKALLNVEAQTYKIAATKRFESLMTLWSSSESLLNDTDFSKVESIKESIKRIDKARIHLAKYSVLFSASTVAHIRQYLEETAKVLTNSEKNFKEGKVTTSKLSDLFKITLTPVPEISLVLDLGDIGDELIPSTFRFLEKYRQQAAMRAREHLLDILRIEFGVQETKIIKSNNSE